jgi:NADH-quinone oxidoreductase subunit M
MGVVTIGIFCFNQNGLLGAVLLMIGHGVVSSALFLLVGMLYDRFKTRVIKYYGGLVHTMPLFSICFVLFTLGNIGLPSTSNFVGELLIVVACFAFNT